MKKRRLFLLDGTAYCYRSFYAIRNLSTRSGEPTNAVYGFLMTLQNLLEDEVPDYLAVCFDHSRKTFRQEKFADYKIQRKPMPDLLGQQLPVIKELLAAWRVPVFEVPGFEADDLLATLTHQALSAGKDLEVVIVTPDKDALQLVGERVRVLDAPRKGMLYGAQEVQARFGVAPQRVADWMALSGDASDNIPGVPGIGPKMATALLSEFETLEDLLNHLDRVDKPSARKLLEEHRDLALMSKELATLHEDAPIEFTLEGLRRQDPDETVLRSLYQRLEFRSHWSRLSPADGSGVDFDRIDASSQFASFLAKVEKAGRVAFDLGIGPNGQIESLALGLEKGPIIVRTNPSDEELKRLFSNARIAKAGHDIKKSLRALAPSGFDIQGLCFDTMLAAYLLDPEQKAESLSVLAFHFVGHACADDPGVDPAKLAERLQVILEIWAKLKEELSEKDLLNLFETVEIPLAHVLADMETRGVGLDVPFLKQLSSAMETELEDLAKKILKEAGSTFNINSPRQLADVLFNQLNLPVIKRTKTGPSTDVEVLEALKDLHPLPKAMLRYRELSKLKSTYIDALPELVDTKTGRLHCTFHQTGTATGRLSTSNPNLQNIPIKTEEGRRIRKAFIPYAKTDRILSADYSQIELRLLAHLSGDEVLIEAFRKGEDIHRITASEIFGVGIDSVTGAMRQAAKTVNFGIIYGMTPYGLSKELSISPPEAGSFIEAVFKRYPKVRPYLHAQIERARTQGYVTTLLNRRRYIPQLMGGVVAVREFGERIAVNAPIQGSAADLIKRAMIDIQAALSEGNFVSSMVLQIHDELVFEVNLQEQSRLIDLVAERMEGVFKLSVPLPVRIRMGKNWLETEEVS